MRLLEFIYAETSGWTIEKIKQEILNFYGTASVIAANLGPTYVYRVRKIEPGHTHSIAADVWHPPPICVTTIGRANNIGEAVFYCSLDPNTAIEEAQVCPGEKFSLAIYELEPREPYNLSSVVIREARFKPSPGLSHLEELSRFGVELSKFIVNEFTREVAPGEEFHYKRSCAIANILFDLPKKDSIAYPSVKNHDAVNIVLKREAACERLILGQVATCIMDKLGDILVKELSEPDTIGQLVPQTLTNPLPARLNISGPRPSFQQLFRDDRIQNSSDILNYHMR